MRAFARRLLRRQNEEGGQGLVEYALIIALVSLAAIAALGFLSGKIQTVFSKSGNSLAAVEASIGSGGSSGGGSPSAPSGGSVSVVCTASPCEDDNNLNATTSGWSANGSPITSYTYQWRDANDGAGNACPGAGSFANFGAPINSALTTNTLNPPDVGDDRCYLVTVTATNGVGTSPAVTSNIVYVDED